MIKRAKDSDRSQNFILFIRKQAEDPSIKGTKKFPKLPIINGITVKKMITNAHLVIIISNT